MDYLLLAKICTIYPVALAQEILGPPHSVEPFWPKQQMPAYVEVRAFFFLATPNSFAIVRVGEEYQ